MSTNGNATRPCKTCQGTGINKGWENYPDKPCYSCDGTGTFPEPEYSKILERLLVTRKGKATFRKSSPDYGRRAATPEHSELTCNRAYYVWRLTRFHGGADVCMPMVAEMMSNGDPWMPELDLLVDKLARRVFGTDLAAAHRWGRALGYLDTDMPGLPASAYQGGPSYDDNKPEDELLETI